MASLRRSRKEAAAGEAVPLERSRKSVYEVRITPLGLRHLDQLPEKVRAAAVEAIFGTIAENPQRSGEPLLGELHGLRSARRGDYRVIYEVKEQNVVVVHRVQHRRDIYRPR